MLSLVPRRSAVITSAFMPAPVVARSWLPTPKQCRQQRGLELSAPVIVDFVLETCVAGCVGSSLPLQHDRAAVRHDQAVPDKQHPRLAERNLAVIDSDQPRSLLYQEEMPRGTVIDVLGDLRRDHHAGSDDLCT